MYTLAVQRDFIASHYLTGGDWGPENQLHSHHYKIEVILEGNTLNRHGYLVDITDIEEILDRLCDQYRDKTLNTLAEFSGLNPSIEHFARCFCQALVKRIEPKNLNAIGVKIWENDIAWAAYRETF